jgi:TolB-like protein
VSSGAAIGDGGARGASAPPRSYRIAAVLADAPIVAILPFVSVGDGLVRPFAHALREEIAAGLHDIDWLVAVSQRAPERADAIALDGKEGAGRSGARYLLHGCVRQERDATCAIIRLTEAASDIQLWAERFQCTADEGFEPVAVKTSRAVSDHIFAIESMRSWQNRPEGAGAWTTIVHAVNLINRRSARQAGAAQALLKKAIAANPNSSAAFALLSFATTLGVHQGWHSRQAAAPSALRAAARAIALDDQDPWGHVAAGYAELFAANNPEHAIAILRRALTLNPNVAMAHYLIALASTYIDKPEAALLHADLAEQLGPRDLLTRGNPGAHDNVRATASFVKGRYGDGMAFARKAIEQSPRQTSAYRQLVLSSAMAGELEQARKALQMVKRLAPEVGRFISEAEPLWPDKMGYRKYVEAFRLAGHK